jgi:hypothetical protein
MQGQNSQREKKLLFVVDSAIVYQNIEFSHSLALCSAQELGAYLPSLRRKTQPSCRAKRVQA